MSFGAKGNGKAKGKGKSSSPYGGQGHLLEKTRISAEKFTGVVVSWKGKYGFVKPDEGIEHEKASLHSGNLFVRFEDLEGTDKLDVGAPVEFHINEDESGLGAEEGGQTGDAPPGAGKAAGKAAGKGKGKDSWGGGAAAWAGGKDSWGGGAAAAWGGGAAAKGGKAGAKGWSLATGGAAYGGAQPVMSVFGKGGAAKGKGKENGKDKGGKGQVAGHNLPRTRITAEKFTGTVHGWKGKYGWVTPSEPIEHEKATKHEGRLFTGKEDIEGGIEQLEEGQVVEFHIYEDASGLGAEEVVVM